jgi:hypothetical protein
VAYEWTGAPQPAARAAAPAADSKTLTVRRGGGQQHH